MKSNILIAVFFLLALKIQAQNDIPQVVKIENKELVELMNGLSGDRHVYASDFNAKIFKKDNAAGSADLEGTHGITTNYLIAISESDEYPVQSLFEIKEFFVPEIVFVIGNENSFTVRIKHLLKDEWTYTHLSIKKHSVEMLNY